MEIPSLKYSCFFATLSVLALIPLRDLLNKVEEISSHSSQLQQLLHAFLCFSLSYGFLFSPALPLDRSESGVNPPVWCYPYLNLMLWFSFQHIADDPESNVFLFIVVLKLLQVSFLITFLALIYLLSTIINGNPGPPETISMSFFHWFAWVICTAMSNVIYHKDHIVKIEFDNPFLPYVVAPTMAYLLFSYQSKSESYVSIKVPLKVKIVVGIVGNILANHYLKDKGFNLFWLVVFFAIFLMGNMAILQSTCHTAVFGFLVGAVVDIAGEIFGLKIWMWLVGGCSAVLFVFFEKLDEFNRPDRGGRKEKVGSAMNNRRRKESSIGDKEEVLPMQIKDVTSLEREGVA